MTTYRIDRVSYAQRLIYDIVAAGGTSVSLDVLVSAWMSRHFSAQILFTHFRFLLSQGGLELVHDPEGTRVRLRDEPHTRRHSLRHSELLSDGETVAFATAVSRMYAPPQAAPHRVRALP